MERMPNRWQVPNEVLGSSGEALPWLQRYPSLKPGTSAALSSRPRSPPGRGDEPEPAAPVGAGVADPAGAGADVVGVPVAVPGGVTVGVAVGSSVGVSVAVPDGVS